MSGSSWPPSAHRRATLAPQARGPICDTLKHCGPTSKAEPRDPHCLSRCVCPRGRRERDAQSSSAAWHHVPGSSPACAPGVMWFLTVWVQSITPCTLSKTIPPSPQSQKPPQKGSSSPPQLPRDKLLKAKKLPLRPSVSCSTEKALGEALPSLNWHANQEAVTHVQTRRSDTDSIPQR